MPNEEFDGKVLESVERYRSYTRYLRRAEEAKNKPVWWRTYRGHVEDADPEHGGRSRPTLWLTLVFWRR